MSENVNDLSKKEFEDFIKEGTALVDFYADWCMPCVMMAPIIDELSGKFKGKIKFGKVNTEDYPDLAKKFDVVSIPNFILFKDGKQTEQFMGSMSAEDFENKLKAFI